MPLTVAKVADWIWMPFGVLSGVGRGMDVLGRFNVLQGEEEVLGVFRPISLQCKGVFECIFTRDSIYAIARICYSNSVCLSVHLSVTRVDQSKTVEARIMQFSPYSSPIPLVFRG